MRKILLSIFTLIGIHISAQDCSDLFISEYVEGPGNNNAIEIYNPTPASIDLSAYTINRYSNGSSIDPESWPLSGSIASGDVIVVGNGQVDSVWVLSGNYWSLPIDPGFLSMLDDHCTGDYDANSTFYFNGDDAMTLEFDDGIDSYDVDIFGKVGEDPGGAWTDDITAGYTDANGGDWWTKRKTLIRKPTVQIGVIQNPILFDPTLEYDSLPDATYSNLGLHICDCSGASAINENKDVSYVMYPNPANRGTEVFINANTLIQNIVLTNILGEQVRFSQSVNTSGLAKGAYIIDIEFSNGNFAQNKLIIE